MHRILKAELALRETRRQDKDVTADITRAEFEKIYDPIDLFSADCERIRFAVTALSREFVFSRADNLKLWHAGKQLRMPEVRFVSLIQDTDVLRRLTGANKPDPCLIATKLADILMPRLLHPQNQQALGILVEQQARLDKIGIEGIATAWNYLTGARLQDYVFEFASDLQRRLLAPPSFEEYKLAARCPPSAISNASDARTAIIAQLLSATLKDASFFVDLQSSTQLRWVDLDPKSIKKLPHYALLDAQISDSFTRWLKSQPPTAEVCGECRRVNQILSQPVDL